MVMFERSRGSRAVSTDWHEFRLNARRNAYSKEEFSDEENIRYNLDTARITGRENPDTYTVDRPIDLLGTNGIDLRELRSQ